MAHLNHIGIAVADLDSMKKLFSILGFEVNHVETVLDQGVKTHFLPLPIKQSNLELLEPIDSTGPVSRFLHKNGPGIHHLSFLVEKGELTDLTARLRQEGYSLTYQQAKTGAHGMKVNFIHPASSGGILIEIMEKIIL